MPEIITSKNMDRTGAGPENMQDSVNQAVMYPCPYCQGDILHHEFIGMLWPQSVYRCPVTHHDILTYAPAPGTTAYKTEPAPEPSGDPMLDTIFDPVVILPAEDGTQYISSPTELRRQRIARMIEKINNGEPI